MGDVFSILAEVDRFCSQVSTAIHSVELPFYTTLTLVVVLSVILFPPRDDLDQV
jgi:hypothetical protein